MKDLLVFIKKDKFNIIVIILSLIILILGSYIFNFIVGLIAFILINLIWLIPYFKWHSKLEKREKIRELKNGDEMVVSSEKRDLSKSKPLKGSDDMAKKSKKKKTLGKKILLGFMILFLVLIVLCIAFFIYIASTAGKFDPDKLYSKDASTLIASDGKTVFAKLGSAMRQKVSFDQMSEELVNAIVATEDSRFFEHNGFDLPRFLKASAGQFLGGNAGGASTLTMQVSKNQYTSTVSSGFDGIKRKFTDIYISMFQIEPNYSKEQILEFYANSYYLGSGAYGVEQASQTYFDKHAKDLNLSEAAMIAGLFQSPYGYDPNIYPEKTEKRRLLVLKLMKRHGYITDEEYNIAKDMTVDKIVVKGKSSTTDNDKYQGFINVVVNEIQSKYNVNPYQYSMKIYTTMDISQQDKLNDIMNGKTYKWENDVVQAGVVAVDNKTGGIVAVGSGRNQKAGTSYKDYVAGTGNTIHQIGSTAKPLYDYGPAIEYNNWNTDHPIIDDEHTYSDGTKVNNWDDKYKGIISMRQALVESRNIPAVKTFQSVDNGKVRDFVCSLGLHPQSNSANGVSPCEDGGKLFESHALGGYDGEYPLSMAGAYSAFANGGYYIEPHSVEKIFFDETNKTLTTDVKKTKVMSPATAYMVTDMLIDAGQNGLGNYSNINGAEFAAKTGTSNYDEATRRKLRLPDNAVNDLWVAGYSPDYSIAVWYGYENNSSQYYNKFGSSQNARLFNAVAKNLFKSGSKFTKPTDVVEVEVEKNTGTALLPSENTPDSAKTTELFRESSKPTEVSARFNRLSDVTDLKATVHGNNATITFKGINTPEGLNEDYWKPYIQTGFGLAKDQNKYLSYVMGYNRSVLGNVVYNIYYKDGNGLKLLTSTADTSATVKLPNVSSPTIVVKASYSIFGAAESNGTETKLDYKGASASDVKVRLVGGNSMTLKLGDTFVDRKDPVEVTLDGEDITNSPEVKITMVITDSEKKEVEPSEVGKEAGTYTITYKVEYNKTLVGSVTKTLVVS